MNAFTSMNSTSRSNSYIRQQTQTAPANYYSTTTATPSRIPVCRPFTIEEPNVVLSYPQELLNFVNPETIDFSIVKDILRPYAMYMNITIHLRLTGYTDNGNYRFESNQFIYGNAYRKILFIMKNGIPNVISD